MLGGIRQLAQSFTGRARSKTTAPAGGCETCDPAILATCQPPEPGSVKPFKYHVLVHLQAKPSEDPTPGAWWPRNVESEPDFNKLTREVKSSGIKGVALTAYEGVQALPGPRRNTAHVLLFPSYEDLGAIPLESLGSRVVEVLRAKEESGSSEPAEGAIPAVPATATPVGGDAAALPSTPLFLLVCGHGKRDDRCRVLGNQLVDELARLLEARGLGKQVTVLRTSHIGGHKYAGNVVAYGPGWATHADWFGGVHAENAERWLDALLASTTCAAASEDLRPFWRGRGDLDKEEQVDLFQRGASQTSQPKDIEDLTSPGLAGAAVA